MRITRQRLRKIISEVLDIEDPTEIEAVEGVWGGDPEGSAKNLELDIDHPHAAGAEETVKSPEMLPRQESMLDENKIRSIIRRALSRK